MLQTQPEPTLAVQFGKVLGSTLLFAFLGVVYAYVAKERNGEQFQWAKGKYPVLALGAAGAIAGILTLLTAGEFDTLVFGGALGIAGLIVDKARTMWTYGSKEYDEQRDRGVNQYDAAVAAFIEALEKGNLEELIQKSSQFSTQHGEPTIENAERGYERTRRQIDEEGIGSLYPDDETLEQVDDSADGEEGATTERETTKTPSEYQPIDGGVTTEDSSTDASDESDDDTLPPA